MRRGGIGLERACDVGLDGVVADVKQRAAVTLGDFISETIAEVQARGVAALPPSTLGVGRAEGGCPGDVHHREARVLGTAFGPFNGPF